MTGVLVALAIALCIAAPLTLVARRRIALHRRPARFAHLTDEQWKIRRTVLLARRASNSNKEPALTDSRPASVRPFGRVYRDDAGERV